MEKHILNNHDHNNNGEMKEMIRLSRHNEMHHKIQTIKMSQFF